MFQNLRLTPQNKILFISFVIFITLYFILNAKNNKTPILAENIPLYADTLIPRGQVLVPIEFANTTALAGLIDHYGIIDLYSGSENNSILIASRVKILKAPLNPNQYAVMVSETLSQQIMKNKGPFLAVVQNRFSANEKGKEKIKPEAEPIASGLVPISKTILILNKKNFKQVKSKLNITKEMKNEINYCALNRIL